jgi:GNAT superfamily N-acetyltransferase
VKQKPAAIIEIWQATPRDEPFLWEMLGVAANWRDAPLAVSELVHVPHLAKYVVGWGRPGDAGVIAWSGGQRVGAAWYRCFSGLNHGYGFVDERTPELTLGVALPWRRQGVGKQLLRALEQLASTNGYPVLSLSVENDNPALRLYERLGYVRWQQVGTA